jgi:hypothetical protein
LETDDLETMMDFTPEITEALAAPFAEDEVDFLPRGSVNGRARALPYIDARSVMRRLDAVVGPGNWSFDFDLLSTTGKMVKGKLTVLGVTKHDAGESSDEGEALKSAVSDAIKRTAVHFGIGRYLYYLPAQWAPYDSQKRRFIETPRLDPATVERALRGVSGNASNVADGGSNRLSSIWSPGAGTRRSGPAPESRGDRAANGASEAKGGGTATLEATAEALRCSGTSCRRTLTRGQHDVSVRTFGQPLCPGCQKQKTQ